MLTTQTIKLLPEFPFQVAIGKEGDYLFLLSELKQYFPNGYLTDEQREKCSTIRRDALVPDSLFGSFLTNALLAGDMNAKELLELCANATVRGLVNHSLGIQTDIVSEFEYALRRKRSVYYRNCLTDAINLFCLLYADVIDERTGRPLISERFKQHVYHQITDAIYKQLYGMKAKELRRFLGLKPHTNLRDVLCLDELKAIEAIELKIGKIIIDDGIRPIAAFNKFKATVAKRDAYKIKLANKLIFAQEAV